VRPSSLLFSFFHELRSTCSGSWTMYYGTIYAMQHKDDDLNAGIKSTALLFGSFARPILSGFCICFIVSLAFVGILNHHGPAYFILTVLGTAFHLLWQISRVDLEDPKSCFATFDANGRRTGLIVASGMAVDYALQVFT
jgi:4-hydroxybenzoate polyprenyltransferase